MSLPGENDLYYDPYDVEIDADPYPTYQRLRDEAPLYCNERLDFWGLSRFADVEAALKDSGRLSSAKGDILEVVKADPVMPPGVFINEDPPEHTMHRALVSRAFTPRRMKQLEDADPGVLRRVPRPARGRGSVRLRARPRRPDAGKAIGMLMGIPEADQPSVRDDAAASCATSPASHSRSTRTATSAARPTPTTSPGGQKHPSDDLVTELLNVEFDDLAGERRTLTQEELLTFIAVIAGAGVETTGRLFGWMGKVLAEHPDQRPRSPRTAPWSRTRSRSCSASNPRPARRPLRHRGRRVPRPDRPGRQRDAADGRRRQPRRTALRGPGPLRHPPEIGQSLTFGYGAHYCLGAALARIEGRIALDEVLNRWPEWEVDSTSPPGAHLDRARLGLDAGVHRVSPRTPSAGRSPTSAGVCAGLHDELRSRSVVRRSEAFRSSPTGRMAPPRCRDAGIEERLGAARGTDASSPTIAASAGDRRAADARGSAGSSAVPA